MANIVMVSRHCEPAGAAIHVQRYARSDKFGIVVVYFFCWIVFHPLVDPPAGGNGRIYYLYPTCSFNIYVYLRQFVNSAAGSSNGRMHPSGGCHLGSNPSPAALNVNIIVVTSWCAGKNPSSLAVTK